MSDSARDDFELAKKIAADARAREQFEDESAALLDSLYDEVAPRLARRLGGQFGAFDEDDNVNRIVWKQTARSAILALLDTLVGSHFRHISVSPSGWAEECFKTLDFKKFEEETGLGREDAIEVIDKTAGYLVYSPLLGQGEKKFLYQGHPISLDNKGDR